MLVASLLETKRFGIPSAKMVFTNAGSLKASLVELSNSEYQFVSCRLPTQEIEAAQVLEKYGFFLTDTLLYFKKSLADEALTSTCVSVLERLQYKEPVMQIAEEAFKDYKSHYASDRRFDPKVIHEIYKDWARRSFDEVGVVSDILVVLKDDDVAGFITVRDQASISEVQLAAVHPKYQGQGVFRSLLVGVASRAKSLGFSEVLYSTQLENVIVQQTLAKDDWFLFKSFYTFHYWKGDS